MSKYRNILESIILLMQNSINEDYDDEDLDGVPPKDAARIRRQNTAAARNAKAGFKRKQDKETARKLAGVPKNVPVRNGKPKSRFIKKDVHDTGEISPSEVELRTTINKAIQGSYDRAAAEKAIRKAKEARERGPRGRTRSGRSSKFKNKPQ